MGKCTVDQIFYRSFGGSFGGSFWIAPFFVFFTTLSRIAQRFGSYETILEGRDNPSHFSRQKTGRGFPPAFGWKKRRLKISTRNIRRCDDIPANRSNILKVESFVTSQKLKIA